MRPIPSGSPISEWIITPQAGMCGKLVKEALLDGGSVMIFIGRLEQDNSKRRRQGVIDEFDGPAG